MRVARRGSRTRDELVGSRAPIPVQPSGTCVARERTSDLPLERARPPAPALLRRCACAACVRNQTRRCSPWDAGAWIGRRKNTAGWYSCFECRGVYTGRFKKLMAKRWLDTSVPTKAAYADVYYAAADNYGDALDWAEAVRFCTNLRSEMLAAVGPDDARFQGATVNIARAMHGLGELNRGRQSRAESSAGKVARFARSVASDARGRYGEPGRGVSCAREAE